METKQDRFTKIKSRIGMPKESSIGDPLSFISLLDDNVDYYELNNQ